MSDSERAIDRLAELVARRTTEQLPPERVEHLLAEDLTRDGVMRTEWEDDQIVVSINGQRACVLDPKEVSDALSPPRDPS